MPPIPCLCPFRGPTMCMSPPCIHLTVCTLHHMYVSPYVCSFMCMPLPYVCPFHVYVPSVCMSLPCVSYVPPCVSPTVCMYHRVYVATVCTPHVYNPRYCAAKWSYSVSGPTNSNARNYFIARLFTSQTSYFCEQACRFGSAKNLKLLRNLVRPPAGCSENGCQPMYS